MTIVFTAGARSDLENILAYTKEHHFGQVSKLEARIALTLARIERHPKNAAAMAQRPGIRVVPLMRYPFKIFYREISGGVEILHMHHTARNTF